MRYVRAMSVRVEIDELAERLDEFGVTPYLLTTSADGRPHATHIVVGLVGRELVCGVGRKSAQNAADRAAVCLLWPPTETGGFSLLVDGDAVVDSGNDETQLRITPIAAVLHRNAKVDGYQADCAPLDGR